MSRYSVGDAISYCILMELSDEPLSLNDLYDRYAERIFHVDLGVRLDPDVANRRRFQRNLGELKRADLVECTGEDVSLTDFGRHLLTEVEASNFMERNAI